MYIYISELMPIIPISSLRSQPSASVKGMSPKSSSVLKKTAVGAVHKKIWGFPKMRVPWHHGVPRNGWLKHGKSKKNG